MADAHVNALDNALPPGTTGVVTIDLDRLIRNWRALAALGRPAACAAVVKADAYGLGAKRCIPALVGAGCTTFFVASLEEAVEARGLAPDAVIYVLDGLLPGSAAVCAETGVRPVLTSLADVHSFSAFAKQCGRRLTAAIHLCTGLHRLGMPETEIDALAQDPDLLAAIDIRLVMSHLASADVADAPSNARQLATFERLRRKLPPAAASLAASDGMMLGAEYHFDLARPGYALYGGQPSRSHRAPVEPVVTVHARILQVRDIAAGGRVGYSGIWTAARPTRLATIAAGYADGIARAGSASNDRPGARVAFGGVHAPVVGRISMDLITIDVTDLDPLSCQAGGWAELIGPAITLEDAGAAAGTIGYEVLTRLGGRFHRTYKGGA